MIFNVEPYTTANGSMMVQERYIAETIEAVAETVIKDFPEADYFYIDNSNDSWSIYKDANNNFSIEWDD